MTDNCSATDALIDLYLIVFLSRPRRVEVKSQSTHPLLKDMRVFNIFCFYKHTSKEIVLSVVQQRPRTIVTLWRE
jgi:hypothetical protein